MTENAFSICEAILNNNNRSKRKLQKEESSNTPPSMSKEGPNISKNRILNIISNLTPAGMNEAGEVSKVKALIGMK